MTDKPEVNCCEQAIALKTASMSEIAIYRQLTFIPLHGRQRRVLLQALKLPR
jgi:hypothetical protein